VRLRNLIRGGLGPIWAAATLEEEEEEIAVFRDALTELKRETHIKKWVNCGLLQKP
jgi:hypothetical protein